MPLPTEDLIFSAESRSGFSLEQTQLSALNMPESSKTKNKVKRLHTHSNYIKESCKILFQLQLHTKAESSYFQLFSQVYYQQTGTHGWYYLATTTLWQKQPKSKPHAEHKYCFIWKYILFDTLKEFAVSATTIHEKTLNFKAE